MKQRSSAAAQAKSLPVTFDAGYISIPLLFISLAPVLPASYISSLLSASVS